MSNKKIYWVVAEVNTRNAGYRIRTLPLVKSLATHGLHVELVSMKEWHTEIRAISEAAAVVIVSKPTDSDSYLCMNYLKENGIKVIVDLFDNYFSWSPALYRRGVPWEALRAVQISSDICTSTPAIAETVRALGFKNIHHVSDAAPSHYETIASSSTIHRKWESPDVIELLWFGISDNPYFYAGIEDLLSWINVVATLQNSLRLFKVRLTICTNRVPAVQDAIMYFVREGINVRFEEWTEQGCAELLDNTHVVLIPTNLSVFSRSKTHNRCSDAIWRQCLVLVSPEGPYNGIPGAVYKSVESIALSLKNINTELIVEQLNESSDYISTHHKVADQANRLVELIEYSPKPLSQNGQKAAQLPPILLAGSTMSITTLKLSRKLNYLSIGIASSAINANFDLLLTKTDPVLKTITLQLSEKCTRYFIEGTSVFSLDDLGTQDWTVVRDNEVTILTITMPDLTQQLERLSALQAIRHAHGDLSEQLFDVASELAIRALHRLGFKTIEYGSNDGAGWQTWFKLCGQHLQKHTSLLRAQWALPGHAVGVTDLAGTTFVS